MFSLGIQDQIAQSMILVVQYVGNLAWHSVITAVSLAFSVKLIVKR